MLSSVRTHRTAARVALGLHVLLASIACGGGGGGGDDYDPTPTGPTPPAQPGQPAQAVTSATVAMRSQADDGYSPEEHAFSPSQVTLRRNGTVTWTNESGVAHNVTFGTGSGAPANVANHSSGSNTRTFGTTGAFSYQCTNHTGMSGTVTVVD